MHRGMRNQPGAQDPRAVHGLHRRPAGDVSDRRFHARVTL